MLIFSRERLAFVATPKTGTTAFEMALKPRADIVFAKHRKHITAQKYTNRVAPWLERMFDIRPESMAVMRDPVEQIRSWYRYRSGPRQAGTPVSTGGCSFDDFVRAVISDDPPPFAQIGSQFNFLTADGEPAVHHLFAYENQPVFRAFLEQRFGTVEIKQKNVSPPADAPLSAEVEAALRAARAPEFALYDRLIAAGGHLRTPIGG
ncbi:MAG: hypothetical protein AAGF60_13870 [Pseudomonadota bacterium]